MENLIETIGKTVNIENAKETVKSYLTKVQNLGTNFVETLEFRLLQIAPIVVNIGKTWDDNKDELRKENDKLDKDEYYVLGCEAVGLNIGKTQCKQLVRLHGRIVENPNLFDMYTNYCDLSSKALDGLTQGGKVGMSIDGFDHFSKDVISASNTVKADEKLTEVNESVAKADDRPTLIDKFAKQIGVEEGSTYADLSNEQLQQLTFHQMEADRKEKADKRKADKINKAAKDCTIVCTPINEKIGVEFEGSFLSAMNVELQKVILKKRTIKKFVSELPTEVIEHIIAEAKK